MCELIKYTIHPPSFKLILPVNPNPNHPNFLGYIQYPFYTKTQKKFSFGNSSHILVSNQSNYMHIFGMKYTFSYAKLYLLKMQWNYVLVSNWKWKMWKLYHLSLKLIFPIRNWKYIANLRICNIHNTCWCICWPWFYSNIWYQSLLQLLDLG